MHPATNYWVKNLDNCSVNVLDLRLLEVLEALERASLAPDKSTNGTRLHTSQLYYSLSSHLLNLTAQGFQHTPMYSPNSSLATSPSKANHLCAHVSFTPSLS